MKRLDVRSKVMGELKFGIDLKMDGMVFASVKLNPNKGQPMKSYDASKAQSMPGVKKILEIKNGVAVIATNSWYAMKAVEAIDCKWAPSTYPAEQADHWKNLEASFKPEFLGKEWRKIGDIDAGLKDGTLVKAEYRAPYVAHQPLEPLNGVAIVYRQGNGNLGWPPEPASRAVHRGDGDRHQAGTGDLSQSMGGRKFRAPPRIRERPCAGRDRKPDARNADQAGLLARGGFSPGYSAADLDRPVQRQRQEREDRRGRSAIWQRRLRSRDCSSAWARPRRIRMPNLAAGMWNVYYDIPNFRATSYEAQGLSPCTTWRSVGASTAGFFTESFIDELIHAAGLDPMKARIEMCSVPTYRKLLETVARDVGLEGTAW